MGWLDSLLGGSGGGSFTDYGSLLGGGSASGGGGLDFGDFFNADTWGNSSGNWVDLINNNDWGDLVGSGGGNGWGDLFGGGSGGGSGGGGSNGSGMMGDIFSALLGGIGGSADAKMSAEMLKITGNEQRKTVAAKGLEDRKSTGFEAELVDYYKNKETYKNGMALDQYSQFSRISKFAPNFQQTYSGPAAPGPVPLPKP